MAQGLGKVVAETCDRRDNVTNIRLRLHSRRAVLWTVDEGSQEQSVGSERHLALVGGAEWRDHLPHRFR